MLRNLQEIQVYINNVAYSNHLGKMGESYYISVDNQNYNAINTAVSENGFGIINIKNQTLRSMMRVLKKILGRQIRDVGINGRNRHPAPSSSSNRPANSCYGIGMRV